MRAAPSVPGRLLTVRGGGGRRERQGRGWRLTLAARPGANRAPPICPVVWGGSGRRIAAHDAVHQFRRLEEAEQRFRHNTVVASQDGIHQIQVGPLFPDEARNLFGAAGGDEEAASVTSNAGPGNRSGRRFVNPYGDVSPPLICVRSKRPNRWTMATLLDTASPVVIQISVSPSCPTFSAGTAPARRHPR